MAFNGSPDEQFSSRSLFTRDTSGHGVLVEINFLEGSGAWKRERGGIGDRRAREIFVMKYGGGD